MSKTNERGRYRFVIPKVMREPIGTQGEIAEYIPYHMSDGATPDKILSELRRQPHLKALADYISSDRRIYLLESSNEELLNLAAEYIGTFHRLDEDYDSCYDEASLEDEESDSGDFGTWSSGDRNYREFDFGSKLPVIHISELTNFYLSNRFDRFGGEFYRGSMRPSHRPWWTMNLAAPLVVNSAGSMRGLTSVLENMEERSRIIILQNATPGEYDDDFFGEISMSLNDLSFELETEMLRLEPAEANGAYKRQILRQLARDKGAPFAKNANVGQVLDMIYNYRGNVDNKTLAKSVSNAVIRRKTTGQLTVNDFRYLEEKFASAKRAEEEETREENLIGQEEVRSQLERIVSSMAFQDKRKKLGLKADKIHYTFAFMGAPGTGKTTWARRLAEQMRRQGLLDDTTSICINAAELKGKYVGHTTGKVKALFDQYGVIILDEAYSLTEEDSFGQEALAQLCVEMENHSNDRLVIFAGYGGSNNSEDNRMLEFLRANPGINSRVSFKVHFANFKAEELVEVFHSMMGAGGYALDRQVDEEVAEFFRRRMKQRAFGNCREVRNLSDRVKIVMAGRLAALTDCTREQASRVLSEDVRAAIKEIELEYMGLEKNERRYIGFCA